MQENVETPAGVARYARAAATPTPRPQPPRPTAPASPRGQLPGFGQAAGVRPQSFHQIRVAVPCAPRQGSMPTETAIWIWPSASGATAKLPPRPGICPPYSPRIVLTNPKESGHRYKIFINVTHPPCATPQKSNLTNSLSTTSEVRPLPEKQKMWDNLRQIGTLIAPRRPPPAPQPPKRPIPAPITYC